MQGTQYAPRESILCMEHFVALQGVLISHHLGAIVKNGPVIAVCPVHTLYPLVIANGLNVKCHIH